MGTAPNCARILASRSAAEGACCAQPFAEARSSVAGKRCARKALPASVTESRTMLRREVCFCKKLDFMLFQPFFRWFPLRCAEVRQYTVVQSQNEGEPPRLRAP